MLTSGRQRWIEATLFVLLIFLAIAPATSKAWRSLNTDFPNYYLTARLAREHVDTSRSYEWLWIQREKDHRAIDQRVVGLVPITPFSTLLVWPIAKLEPLRAKHVWIILNLILLAAIVPLLARASGLTTLQAAILCGLSYPLQRNLLFGQFYIVLLAVLIAACWAHQRGRNTLAGALVGLAAALKIYPILLSLHLLKTRNWRAIAAGAAFILAATFLSVAVLGINMNRTYLLQVLPWALRGDALPPFNIGSGSVSTVLHRLFVYEPQWNPRPVMPQAWMFAVLHPLLQLAIVGPVILLIRSRNSSPLRTRLEWSALLFSALTISTIPASYQFTVLILPVALLCGHFLRVGKPVLLCISLALFLVVGYPPHVSSVEGWRTLLGVPRLYCLLALTSISFVQLAEGRLAPLFRTQRWWAGLASTAALSIVTGLRYQHASIADFSGRLPLAPETLLAAHPEPFDNDVAYIALAPDGYRLRKISAPYTALVKPLDTSLDQLSIAVSGNRFWTEDTQSNLILHSQTFDPQKSELKFIDEPWQRDSKSPIVSADGSLIAFLRRDEGRDQLFLHELSNPSATAVQQTTKPYNVYEATFAADNSLIIAATYKQSNPAVYRIDTTGKISPLDIGVARYPAVSPDGRWMIFSRLVAGNWNLFLLDLRLGGVRRVTEAPCNQIEAAWQSDSKTIVYANDCGRALWFTALVQRRILPIP
jgi:hypothetical protein